MISVFDRSPVANKAAKMFIQRLEFAEDPVCSAGLFHLKTTGRRWSPDAAFFDRRTDYLSEQ
jgi:hypothetical protein